MLVYDIEIVKAIRMKNSDPELPGIEYVPEIGGKAFQMHDALGISVIGAYDFEADQYRVFTESSFDEFEALVAQHNIIVGFNSIQFDNAVCRANGIDVPDELSYDILREMWLSEGLGTQFHFRTHGGFGLDKTAEVNFGLRKTGHGALAPVWWQRGEIGRVVDYCLEDVRLTKMLLDRIIEQRWLLHPKQAGTHLEMVTPWERLAMRKAVW